MKESFNGSHNYVVKAIDEGKDEKVALVDENVFPGNTEQHKTNFLIKEGSIEGRSHDATDQDGKSHVNKVEDYYIAQDESKAVAIKENGINHNDKEEYYTSPANIKKVIERKGRVRVQASTLRVEVLESAEQCNEGHLSI